MKNIYFSLLFMTASYFATSQVVIEGSDFIQPYTILTYETVDSLSTIDLFINGTGQNLDWDITNWVSGGEMTEDYVPIDNLSPIIQLYFNNESLYPQWLSTHALEGNVDLDLDQLDLPIEITEPRTYFRTDETGYYNTGISFSAMGMPIVTQYEVIDRFFKFPMQYGDTATGEVKFLISVPMLGDYGQYGSRASKVDAEGTLTTPYGTYQALRVKMISHITDTIFSDFIDGGQSFERPEQIDYFWLSPQVEGPVFQVSTIDDQVIGIQLLVSQGTSIGLSDRVSKEIKIYPNPATDFISIDMPFAEKATIYIYNTQGKLVLKTVSNLEKINIQSLKPGLYVARSETPHGAVYHQKFMVTR